MKRRFVLLGTAVALLAIALLGQPVTGALEAVTYPVCSHDLCATGTVTTCRCPSGSCRAGKLSWCNDIWHPTCYCY